MRDVDSTVKVQKKHLKGGIAEWRYSWKSSICREFDRKGQCRQTREVTFCPFSDKESSLQNKYIIIWDWCCFMKEDNMIMFWFKYFGVSAVWAILLVNWGSLKLFSGGKLEEVGNLVSSILSPYKNNPVICYRNSNIKPVHFTWMNSPLYSIVGNSLWVKQRGQNHWASILSSRFLIASEMPTQEQWNQLWHLPQMIVRPLDCRSSQRQFIRSFR